MIRALLVAVFAFGSVCAGNGQMFLNGSVGTGKEVGAGVGYRYQADWLGFEYGSMMQWHRGHDNVYGLFASLLAFGGSGQWYGGVGYEDCHSKWDEVVSYKKAYKSFRKGHSWGNGVLILGKKLTPYSFVQLSGRFNGVRGDAATEMPKVALTFGF